MDNLGLSIVCNQDLYSFESFESIFWKWEIQNISNDQKKVKISNYGNEFTKNMGLHLILCS